MMENGLFKYIGALKKRSFFVKTLLTVTSIELILILLFFLFYYAETSSILKQELESNNISALQRTQEGLDPVFAELQNLAVSISIQDDTTSYTYTTENIISGWRIYDNLRRKNKTFLNVYDYIDSIYIYSDLRKEIIADADVYHIDSFTQDSWLGYYDAIEDDYTYSFLRKKNDYYMNVLTIIKPIFRNRHDKIGAIVINVNLETLGKRLDIKKNPMLQYSIITDSDGTIYYSQNREIIDKNIKEVYGIAEADFGDDEKTPRILGNERKEMIAVLESNTEALYYWSVIPPDYYYEKTSATVQKYILIAALFLLFGVLISFAISFYSFRPIAGIMALIKKNNHDEEENTTDDELHYITNYIAASAAAKVDMKKQLDEQLIKLRETHNMALQSQINPHFLYNTLEYINWKAFEEVGATNEVSEIISSLSEIYKYIMRVNDFWVTLGEEILHCRKYVEILQKRYSDKFDIEWIIPAELEQFYTVKLSLQPIIENAIYHGIKPMPKKGHITVRAELEEDIICLSVEDDGMGIPEEKLKELNKRLKSDLVIDDDHVGITNVNQRIKVVFGMQYGVRMKNNERGGATVTLCFPAKKAEE